MVLVHGSCFSGWSGWEPARNRINCGEFLCSQWKHWQTVDFLQFSNVWKDETPRLWALRCLRRLLREHRQCLLEDHDGTMQGKMSGGRLLLDTAARLPSVLGNHVCYLQDMPILQSQYGDVQVTQYYNHRHCQGSRSHLCNAECYGVLGMLKCSCIPSSMNTFLWVWKVLRDCWSEVRVFMVWEWSCEK